MLILTNSKLQYQLYYIYIYIYHVLPNLFLIGIIFCTALASCVPTLYYYIPYTSTRKYISSFAFHGHVLLCYSNCTTHTMYAEFARVHQILLKYYYVYPFVVRTQTHDSRILPTCLKFVRAKIIAHILR